MIKHLLTTLCALALVTTGSIPALAAEADTGESARYYPHLSGGVHLRGTE